MQIKSNVIIVSTDTGFHYLDRHSTSERNRLSSNFAHAMFGDHEDMQRTAEEHSKKDQGKTFAVAEVVLIVPESLLSK